MPCVKCSNGKWRLGSGQCMYKTLEACKKAERAYHASKDGENDREFGSELESQHKEVSSDRIARK